MTRHHAVSGWAMRFMRGKGSTASLRWMARRLELRSFGLVPEHFNLMEGYRAALAVAVPLLVTLLTQHMELGWAVFAAFWTCLCDAPGPDAHRRRLLALFVVFGALMALAGSWGGSLWPTACMIVGPALVLIAVVGASGVPFGGLLGTLLAVVGVVAAGFPHSPQGALIQSGAFLMGAAWAYVLINVVWRIDDTLPLQRATEAVMVRLFDMADDLVALGEGPHHYERWHSEHAQHRRAVRLALERLRGMLDRYAAQPQVIAPVLRARHAAETLFSAMIALDHAFINRLGAVEERLAVTRLCRTVLIAWWLVMQRRSPADKVLAWGMTRLVRVQSRLSDDLCLGVTLALEEMLAQLFSPSVPVFLAEAPSRPVGGVALRKALRQAVRQSAGLVGVYYAAMIFKLGYPYWAAMAVIVVLQGGVRVTWTRCLERILGSLLGGALALAVLHIVDATAFLSVLAMALAAGAIALRTVNYTVFVVFLTMLFITVTEILQPGTGIASARMLNNVIGSLAALIAVFVLWPDFTASVTQRIHEGLVANRAYHAAVQALAPLSVVENVRRNAGLASIEAETALHDLGELLHWRRLPEPGKTALKDLRHVAGEAAMAWHRRLATERFKASVYSVSTK